MNAQYWIAVKDLKDTLVIGIPFELSHGKSLLGAKREATKRLNAYVPPVDLIESDPVAYIATGMNRKMEEWKRVAEKKRNKKWATA